MLIALSETFVIKRIADILHENLSNFFIGGAMILSPTLVTIVFCPVECMILMGGEGRGGRAKGVEDGERMGKG